MKFQFLLLALSATIFSAPIFGNRYGLRNGKGKGAKRRQRRAKAKNIAMRQLAQMNKPMASLNKAIDKLAASISKLAEDQNNSQLKQKPDKSRVPNRSRAKNNNPGPIPPNLGLPFPETPQNTLPMEEMPQEPGKVSDPYPGEDPGPAPPELPNEQGPAPPELPNEQGSVPPELPNEQGPVPPEFPEEEQPDTSELPGELPVEEIPSNQGQLPPLGPENENTGQFPEDASPQSPGGDLPKNPGPSPPQFPDEDSSHFPEEVSPPLPEEESPQIPSQSKEVPKNPGPVPPHFPDEQEEHFPSSSPGEEIPPTLGSQEPEEMVSTPFPNEKLPESIGQLPPLSPDEMHLPDGKKLPVHTGLDKLPKVPKSEIPGLSLEVPSENGEGTSAPQLPIPNKRKPKCKLKPKRGSKIGLDKVPMTQLPTSSPKINPKAEVIPGVPKLDPMVPDSPKTNVELPPASNTTPKNPSKEYSLTEIGKHNKETDCWIVINGKVLDVTKFLAKHPGGKAAIMKYAGKDATSSKFLAIHKPDVIETNAPEAVIGKLKL